MRKRNLELEYQSYIEGSLIYWGIRIVTKFDMKIEELQKSIEFHMFDCQSANALISIPQCMRGDANYSKIVYYSVNSK